MQIGNVTGHVDRRDLPVLSRRDVPAKIALQQKTTMVGLAVVSHHGLMGANVDDGAGHIREQVEIRSGQISEARQSVCELGEGEPCLHQASS